MGFQPTASPDMGEWWIETRGESVIISRPKGDEVAVRDDEDPWMEIDFAELAHLRAAIDQALRIHRLGQEYSWATPGPDGTLVPVEVIVPSEYMAVEFPASDWLALLRRNGELGDDARHEDRYLRTIVRAMTEDEGAPDLVRVETARQFLTCVAGEWPDPEQVPPLVGRLRRVLADALKAWEQEWQAKTEASFAKAVVAAGGARCSNGALG